MKKPYFLAIALALLSCVEATGEKGATSLPLSPASELSYGPRLAINNRPLAKINGRVISLYDVVKKMDLFLFENYPNLSLSPVEKYKFYMSQWSTALNDMIHNELILMDGEQKEIAISDGAVREELEKRFGPHTMSNLHAVNYGYEEAREMIRRNLTVDQLVWLKVHSKALQRITPQVIKGAYEQYLKSHPPQEEWKYQVLSIRGADQEQCAEIAEKAYNLLEKEGQPLDKIPAMTEEEGVTIHLSDDYTGSAQKLSTLHFDAIKALTPQSYSPPISQISRFDGNTVLRIFYLKDVAKNLPDSLEKIHDKLRNELLFKTSDEEKAAYISSLKERFGYQNYNPKFELPKDYQPFALL